MEGSGCAWVKAERVNTLERKRKEEKCMCACVSQHSSSNQSPLVSLLSAASDWQFLFILCEIRPAERSNDPWLCAVIMALDKKNKKKHTQQNYNYIILLKMSFSLQCFQRCFTCKEEIPPSVSVAPTTEIISQSQQTTGCSSNTRRAQNKWCLMETSVHIYSKWLGMRRFTCSGKQIGASLHALISYSAHDRLC